MNGADEANRAIRTADLNRRLDRVIELLERIAGDVRPAVDWWGEPVPCEEPGRSAGTVPRDPTPSPAAPRTVITLDGEVPYPAAPRWVKTMESRVDDPPEGGK